MVCDSEETAYEMIPAKRQKEALRFVLDNTYQLSDWYDKAPIYNYVYISNKPSQTYLMSTVRNLVSKGRLRGMELSHRNQMAAKVRDSYSLSGYLSDLYSYVWRTTINGSTPNSKDLSMQYAYVQSLMTDLGLADGDTTARIIALDSFYDSTTAEQISEMEYLNADFAEQMAEDYPYLAAPTQMGESDVLGGVASVQ